MLKSRMGKIVATGILFLNLFASTPVIAETYTPQDPGSI
ncbi:hypothetical protein UAO_01669 [Enterococcus villorum ATCC 700913]|uniref:Uncharacterized protein n=1 Tax=Enterococcus villorum ATCC 700913 TaxID=1158604 RepID=A0ABN0KFX1_9ENTE|nr:hypothetical protein UAO_01669 [Enterococcus villorum ATCC 700913]EOW76204.1 hypothetical protein I591_01506 [Enterococcus villorum ATCC 700913]